MHNSVILVYDGVTRAFSYFSQRSVASQESGVHTLAALVHVDPKVAVASFLRPKECLKRR